MKPEILKKAIQLQKEIDELEESSWFSREYEIPSFLQFRIRGLISDEIEARKIMLADLGEE